MARQTQVILIDDIDGGEADETVNFAIDGTDYEIDLHNDKAARLRKVLEEFIPSARKAPKVGGKPTRRALHQVPIGDRMTRQESAAMRRWLIEHGFAVAKRGRIPEDMQLAYQKGRYAPAQKIEPIIPPDPMAKYRLVEPFTEKDEKAMMAQWWADNNRGNNGGKGPHATQWSKGMKEFRELLAQ